jgi:hypothetical protein
VVGSDGNFNVDGSTRLVGSFDGAAVVQGAALDVVTHRLTGRIAAQSMTDTGLDRLDVGKLPTW